MTWQLTVAGLAIGVIVGMTGMGGGSLMTPLLVLLFGFEPRVAVGTDLLHGAIFKTLAAVRHRRLGTVEARLSSWMFVASAPMSLLGVAASLELQRRLGPDSNSVQAQIVGGALLVGAIGIAAKTLRSDRVVGDERLVMTRRNRLAAVVIGALGGFVVGLTSVGSGVFFGLTLLVVFPLRAAKVVGTDIFHAAALLWVAGLGHLVAGNVDTTALMWLLLGSAPGVLIGSQLTTMIPDRPLRFALVFVLALSAVSLLKPAPAVLVAGVLLVLVVGVVIYRRRRARRAEVAAPPDRVPDSLRPEAIVPSELS